MSAPSSAEKKLACVRSIRPSATFLPLTRIFPVPPLPRPRLSVPIPTKGRQKAARSASEGIGYGSPKRKRGAEAKRSRNGQGAGDASNSLACASGCLQRFPWWGLARSVQTAAVVGELEANGRLAGRQRLGG